MAFYVALALLDPSMGDGGGPSIISLEFAVLVLAYLVWGLAAWLRRRRASAVAG